MVRLSKTPSFPKTKKWLDRLSMMKFERILSEIGERGVTELSRATPKDTTETASSWSYKISIKKDRYRVSWYNSVMAGETPLVILLQYGHGTRRGGYVAGRDFINPAMEPVFNQFIQKIRQEVKV